MLFQMTIKTLIWMIRIAEILNEFESTTTIIVTNTALAYASCLCISLALKADKLTGIQLVHLPYGPPDKLYTGNNRDYRFYLAPFSTGI